MQFHSNLLNLAMAYDTNGLTKPILSLNLSVFELLGFSS